MASIKLVREDLEQLAESMVRCVGNRLRDQNQRVLVAETLEQA